MARIKIKDLPRDMKISTDEMKRVKGGLSFTTRALTSPTDYIKIDHKIDSLVDGKLEFDVVDSYLDSDIKWE